MEIPRVKIWNLSEAASHVGWAS